MELMMEEVKRYSDNNSGEEEEDLEEEEEAVEEEIITRRGGGGGEEEEEESSSKQYYYHNNNNCPFSSPSLSFSSSPSTTNHDVINIPHQQQQNPWLGMNNIIHHEHDHSPESHNSSSGLRLLHHNNQHDAAAAAFTNHNSNLNQLDFMELSLGNNNKDVIVTSSDNHIEAKFQQGTSNATNVPSSSTNQSQPSTSTTPSTQHEKEHMFDKVVTPSDVGKLNRLVIPKQHAEKYFPLDSTSNEKGLLLNFEDRNGKLWRFRYSYWNSSQSYVMTKGWSRFVKEKKLDAGDIVSFQRGVGDLYRHRLYIDWKRRSSNHHHHLINGPDHHHPSTTLFTPFFLPNHPPPHYSIRWGGANSRLYSLPSQQPPRQHHQHDPLQQQQLNYNYHMYPFRQHHVGGGNGIGNHQNNYNNYHELSSGGSGSVYYMRPALSMAMTDARQLQQEGGGASVSPMIIDSVPVAHHHHNHHQQHGGSSSGNITTSTNSNTAAKRLRLFGVNMECASNSTNDEDPKCFSLMSTTSSVAHVAMASSIPTSLQHLRLPHDQDTILSRGEASMLFDLDPSLQYRQ